MGVGILLVVRGTRVFISRHLPDDKIDALIKPPTYLHTGYDEAKMTAALAREKADRRIRVVV
jgi:hypothetical protein